LDDWRGGGSGPFHIFLQGGRVMFGEDRCSFGWRLLCALCTDFVLNSDVVLKSGWLGEAPVTSAMATVAVVSRLASKSASPRSSSSSDSEATQNFPAPALKKTS
jgi:hypothetical protein